MRILRTGYTRAAYQSAVTLHLPTEDGGVRSVHGHLLGMQRLDGVLQHYLVRRLDGPICEVPLEQLSNGSRLSVVRAGLGMPVKMMTDTRDDELLEAFEAWLPLERERIAIGFRGPDGAKDPRYPDAYRIPWQQHADLISSRMAHTMFGVEIKTYVLRALVLADPSFGVQFNEKASPITKLAWSLSTDMLVGRPAA